MKQTTSKPDDLDLKYFTRELYAKCNSTDEEVVDRAEAEWEKAIKDYRGHLRQLQPKLPRGARLFEKISLHDAELIDEPRASASGQWGRIAVAGGMVFDKSTIHLLRYELTDRIRRVRHKVAWPFSRKQVQWLYDEIDISGELGGCFVHRILFSDGSIALMPFKDVHIQAWPSELLQGISAHNEPNTSGRRARAAMAD